MKIRVLLFASLCAVLFFAGCRRVDHFLNRRVPSSQCSVRSQSPLAGMSYIIKGDSLMFTYDWPESGYRDTNWVHFERSGDTIKAHSVIATYYTDGRDAVSGRRNSYDYNIIVDGQGKAVQYYTLGESGELEYPEFIDLIEYENGRVSRIHSLAGQGRANFTYDERGNVIKIVADDVTSLAPELTFEYGQDSVLFNVPIHPTVYGGYQFFAMQLMGWIPPLAKFQKTKSVYFDRYYQQVREQFVYTNYNTDFLGRITSFEANGEKVKLGWECKIPSVRKYDSPNF